MRVLSNLEFKNSTYILNKFNNFPENPIEGMTVFKENGLYIYSLSQISGQLEWLNILDFTRVNSSYKFEQTSENIEWTINHGLNTQDLFVIVYDSNGNKQVESEIQFQSDNEIKLIFSESISGKALLFGASVVSSPSNIYTKEEIDELLKNIEVSGGGSNIILPEGGSDGYLLSKSGDELGWTNPSDVGTKLPENGLNGQVLSVNNGDLTWSNPKAPVKLNVGDLVYTFADMPPANTFLCDSTLISKTDYSKLYSVIGDKFTSEEALVNEDKLVVPVYSYSSFTSIMSEVTEDLTLGNNSYRSVILDNKIKVTTYGANGGVQSGYANNLDGWTIFNDSIKNSGYNQNNFWSTNQTGIHILEIEHVDGTKFAPYMYGIKRSYDSQYYFSSMKFQGYNEESSTWIDLDTQSCSTSVPSTTELQLYKISGYDNTVLYSKFRLEIVAANYGQIDWFRIYGTKEGEASIYDGFALPPSSTNELGAKACIVHSEYYIQDPAIYTTEEQIVGTWLDGRNVYRLTVNVTTGSAINTNNQMLNINRYNIDILLSINGYYETSSGAKLLPNFTPSSGASISTWINNSGYLTELHSSASCNNSSGILTLEYVKSE